MVLESQIHIVHVTKGMIPGAINEIIVCYLLMQDSRNEHGVLDLLDARSDKLKLLGNP